VPISVIDCASGAWAIYKYEREFKGYNRIGGFRDPKNSAVGVSADSCTLYSCSADPLEYMIQIRGSAKAQWTKDWTDDDVSIGLGRLPDRTNDAYDYINNFASAVGCQPGRKLVLVGHSLGGHMAQVIGYGLGIPFITFNAPPALRSGKLPNGMIVGASDIGLNFRVHYDPVSRAPGNHIGPLITLPLGGHKAVGAHKMDICWQSVYDSRYRNDSVFTRIALENA
jgi:hypothetical protein